jgi:hypothetical protein
MAFGQYFYPRVDRATVVVLEEIGHRIDQQPIQDSGFGM